VDTVLHDNGVEHSIGQSDDWVSGRRELAMAAEKLPIPVALPLTYLAAAADRGGENDDDTNQRERRNLRILGG